MNRGSFSSIFLAFNWIVLMGAGLAYPIFGIIAIYEGERKAFVLFLFGLGFLYQAMSTFGIKINVNANIFARWFCYTFGLIYTSFVWVSISTYSKWSDKCHEALLSWQYSTGNARELRWHEYVAVERLMMENMYYVMSAVIFVIFYPMVYHVVINKSKY